MEALSASNIFSRALKKHECTLPRPLLPEPTDHIAGSYDFYHLNVIISGIFALLAIFITIGLIVRHATHISKPRQQLQIIRICTFVPLFAIGLWVSIYLPRAYVYIDASIFIIEPIAVTCFYFFVCEIASLHISPGGNPSFRDVFLAPLIAAAHRCGNQRIDQSPDMSILKFKRLNWLVLQGIPASLLIGILMIITEAKGIFCLTAHDAQHAHLYLLAFKGIVTGALLIAVVRTTVPLKGELRAQNAKALTKLAVFKLLIFLQVTQSAAFGILASVNPPSVRNSTTLSEADWLIGIPGLLTEIELVLFAIFFHYAYGVSLYTLTDEKRAAGEEYVSYGWGIIPKIFIIPELPAFWKFVKNILREIEAYQAEHPESASVPQQPKLPSETSSTKAAEKKSIADSQQSLNENER
ncbi:organic solute transporter Ostalpha-domain-containing protein [Xylariaceae sp. FL1019]|nr:organic solute transporter Ostalpha-domain-containing protein [Xylariaceae sp. FL1019]